MKYFTNREDPGTVGCLDGVGPLDAAKEIFSQGGNLPVVISFTHKIEKRGKRCSQEDYHGDDITEK